MLMFRDLISSEYNSIKNTVRKKSFQYHLNESDLLSAFNEKISVTVSNRNFEMEHISQFWYYINRAITSCAVDLVRRRNDTIELTYQDKLGDFNIETNISAIRIIDCVLSGIKRPHHKEVFIAVVVNGEGYDIAAKRLGVTLANLKTIIFQVRKKAQEKYGKVYLEAIA